MLDRWRMLALLRAADDAGGAPAGGAPAGGDPAGGAPGGTPGGAPGGTPGGGAPAGGVPDWLAGVDDAELKGFVATKGWKGPADALKSYRQLEPLIAAKGVIPLKADASDEEFAKWEGHAALGRPDKPEAYKIDVPEGTEVTDALKGYHGALRPALHAAGLSQRQVDIVTKAHNAFISEQVKGQAEAVAKIAETRQATEAELRREWGNDYENKIETAKAVARQAGLAADADQLAAIADSPAFARLLVTAAGAILPDGELQGLGGVRPDAAKAEYDKIMSDKNHPYFKADDPGHKAAVAHMGKLAEAIWPGKVTE